MQLEAPYTKVAMHKCIINTAIKRELFDNVGRLATMAQSPFVIY